jgi:formate dehydrogenase major subunit/formate dehydrogenase alpha subunit
VAGLAATLGSGAMTNSIAEIEGLEVILIIGSNTKETHPVVANRMIRAWRRKGTKIIVADPRKVPMVRFSELFLNLRPGTDVALLNGLAHVILREGLHDQEFIANRTEGFQQYRDSLADYTPEMVAGITGVPAEEIVRAARLYGGSRQAAIFYTMGITQHTCGTENVFAIANLALLTGNIGRESTGVNPLRGQNNVQGSSDAGCLPNVYPGYQRVDLPEVREKFQRAWGASLSPHKGMTATEMIPAAAEGRLKALYIMGENPVLSDPNQHHTVEALKKLDLLVVQDIFLTETARLADVVLPAACFAEKSGTFSNTERKVQMVRKAVEPPGAARDDLDIIQALATRLGYPMDYAGPEEVLREFGQVWPALGGVTYDRLDACGLAWPCPTVDHPGTRFLHQERFSRGLGLFSVVPYRPPAETADAEYPLTLTTGRNLYQYHTGTMTRRVESIERHAGEPYVEMNPADARHLSVTDGETVRVTSRRGSIDLKARLTPRIPHGTVFIPMHYHEAAVNALTQDALDPIVKIPEFKVAAVKVDKP